MSNQSVDAVRRYNQAFHRLHGRLPDVRMNSGWIRINNGPKSFRPNEVREMAINLERRAREEGRPPQMNNENSFEVPEIVDDEWNVINEEKIIRDEHRAVVERIKMELRRHKHEESNVWDVRDELNARVQAQIQNEVKQVTLDNNESGVNLTGWKKTIRKDTMVMFFNKLFERAGNSAHRMQHMMDFFVHTGQFDDRDDEPDCEECGALEDLQEEIEHYRSKYHDLERERNHYRERNNELKTNILGLRRNITQMEVKLNELKKNSIIFSMDEVQF